MEMSLGEFPVAAVFNTMPDVSRHNHHTNGLSPINDQNPSESGNNESMVRVLCVFMVAIIVQKMV